MTKLLSLPQVLRIQAAILQQQAVVRGLEIKGV